MAILLLSTEACHLCDLAQVVLQKAHQQHPFDVYLQDIIEQQVLLDRYAEKIPVLIDEASQKELCWPFDVDDVVCFLAQLKEA